MVFIPNGVEINASTDWKPVWSWFLFIYVMGVVTLVFIPSLYFAVKIYKKFEEEQIRKKWRYFLIGLIGLYIFAFGTLFSNALNIQTFRTIWSIISLILVIISPISITISNPSSGMHSKSLPSQSWSIPSPQTSIAPG